MNFLLDTNIISELCRRIVNPGVQSWADRVTRPYVSVVSVEEIGFGLAWRPNERIRSWFDNYLHECDVVDVDWKVARRAGLLRGEFQARGETRSQADMLIAATGVVHGLTVVTRNTADFADSGVTVFNPFSEV